MPGFDHARFLFSPEWMRLVGQAIEGMAVRVDGETVTEAKRTGNGTAAK